MTKQIEDTLGLPPLEDFLDNEQSPENEKILNEISRALDANGIEIEKGLVDPDGVREHTQEMDEVIDLAMTAHKDAIDMAFNMEPKNAGSIMEPAARFLEMAMKASQNKIDARMKAIKLKIEQEKHDRDMKKNEEEGVIEGETPVPGQLHDRNALLKSLKNQGKT